MKYVCDVCGWEYDEEKGYPEGGIAPGTKWEESGKSVTGFFVRWRGRLIIRNGRLTDRGCVGELF